MERKQVQYLAGICFFSIPLYKNGQRGCKMDYLPSRLRGWGLGKCGIPALLAAEGEDTSQAGAEEAEVGMGWSEERV